jgi:hypothetical protein
MYIKASALTKLSAAVESTVRYKNPPTGLDDRELLALSTRHDPALLDNFKATRCGAAAVAPFGCTGMRCNW